MTPTPTDGSLKWYVARTAHGMERRVLRDVQKMGFESYAPFGVTQSGMSIPVFPCYAFVRFDIECEGWQNINDLYGVSKLLPLHRPYPIPVTSRFIDACRAKELAGEFNSAAGNRLLLKYRPGDAVRIRSGTLEGRTGRFVEQRNDNVVMLVPIFNTQTKITLPVAQVVDVG